MVGRYLKLEDTINFLVWDAARSITRTLQPQLARNGVVIGALPFLRALWDLDGQTQRELSVSVRRTGPTTTAAIRNLERAGLVRQRDNAYDRRKVNVFLTAKGRRLNTVVMPEVEAIMRQTLIGFSAAEREQLKSMLLRYRDNLQRHPDYMNGASAGPRSGKSAASAARGRLNGHRSARSRPAP